jgi:acetyl esterase
MLTASVTVEDVVYRDSPREPLLARLYRPSGRGPHPAIVSVHGGRWVAETRLTNAVIDQALTAAGVLVVALDFRMPPGARYPEPVADINFAIRWLKRSAERFAVVPAWVGGLGTSSGGHQLMLNALKTADPRYAGIRLEGEAVSAELAWVVGCWPVLDPLARYRMAKARGMERHIQAHEAYWPNEAAMVEGSPQAILERGEQQALPPLFLIQGLADTTVPPDMTDRFAATYRAAGGQVSIAAFEGEAHTFITKRPEAPASKAAIEQLVGFVRAQVPRAK